MDMKRSLTLREESRLRVFENRALRGLYGSMRDEVTGDWRKVHTNSFIIHASPQVLLT
jgi:hypothetical protein